MNTRAGPVDAEEVHTEASVKAKSCPDRNLDDHNASNFKFMYEFRCTPCSKVPGECKMTKETCFFSHNAQTHRRVPWIQKNGLYNYIPEECTNFKKFQKCPRGDECRRAHGWLELIFHPLLYKTKLCDSERTPNGLCKAFNIHCAKAHCPAEVRNLKKIFGMKWKRHYDLARKTFEDPSDTKAPSTQKLEDAPGGGQAPPSNRFKRPAAEAAPGGLNHTESINQQPASNKFQQQQNGERPRQYSNWMRPPRRDRPVYVRGKSGGIDTIRPPSRFTNSNVDSKRAQGQYNASTKIDDKTKEIIEASFAPKKEGSPEYDFAPRMMDQDDQPVKKPSITPGKRPRSVFCELTSPFNVTTPKARKDESPSKKVRLWNEALESAVRKANQEPRKAEVPKPDMSELERFTKQTSVFGHIYASVKNQNQDKVWLGKETPKDESAKQSSKVAAPQDSPEYVGPTRNQMMTNFTPKLATSLDGDTMTTPAGYYDEKFNLPDAAFDIYTPESVAAGITLEPHVMFGHGTPVGKFDYKICSPETPNDCDYSKNILGDTPQQEPKVESIRPAGGPLPVDSAVYMNLNNTIVSQQFENLQNADDME